MAKARKGLGLALFIGGTLAVAGVTTAIVVLGGGGGTGDTGKTGLVPPVDEKDVKEKWPSMICACADAGLTRAEDLAACVARVYWKDLDYSWPPPPGTATASHIAAWAILLSTVQVLAAAAAQAGESLCDFIRKPDVVIIITVPKTPPDDPDVPVIPSEPADPITQVTEEPTPGAWYRVKFGDSLLAIAGKAYGFSSGTSERLHAAVALSDNELNKGFLVASKPGFEANNFGIRIVHLMPKWDCSNNIDKRYVAGMCQPLLWIPPV